MYKYKWCCDILISLNYVSNIFLFHRAQSWAAGH